MSNNRSLHELTYDEVFENTILKVELALEHNVARKIYIEAEIVKDIKYLGCCFIKNNGKAQVVYYPGIPHPKHEIGKNIPLEHILERVDGYLENNHPDLIYKKHITVGVHNITYKNENDFVAIAEVNHELCTIYPKKLITGTVLTSGTTIYSDTEYLTKDEFKYLKNHIPTLSETIRRPNIGGFLDRASNGYRIAAIHADSVTKTCSAEAIAAHEAELEKKWFYEKHPILTGIFAGLLVAIFISLFIYLTIMTAGGFGFGIVLGGAITTAATVFGTSTVATVFTSILMGLGLGGLFAGIGGSIGAALDSSCKTQEIDTYVIPINDNQSSQAIIHKAMDSCDTDELEARGDYFCEQEKYSVAIMYYDKAYCDPLKSNSKNMQAYYKREYLANMLAAKEYAQGNDIDSQFHCKNAYKTAVENYKLIKSKGDYLPKPDEFKIGNVKSDNIVSFKMKDKHHGHCHGQKNKHNGEHKKEVTITAINTLNLI